MKYTPSPAGFWKRYVAYFIDIMMIYVAVEILSTIYFSFQASSELGTLMEIMDSLKAANAAGDEPDLTGMIEKIQTILIPAMVFSSTAFLLIGGVYFSMMESSRHQATLGKRLLGIKVTNVQGEPITLLQSVGRYVSASLSWITLNLGHALAAWTPDRRALHDFIADTRVENVDPKNTQMPIWAWLIIGLHGLVFVGSCVALMISVWLLMQQVANI